MCVGQTCSLGARSATNETADGDRAGPTALTFELWCLTWPWGPLCRSMNPVPLTARVKTLWLITCLSTCVSWFDSNNRWIGFSITIFAYLLFYSMHTWGLESNTTLIQENRFIGEPFLNGNTAFKQISTSTGDGARGCLMHSQKVLASNPGVHGRSCRSPWLAAH